MRLRRCVSGFGVVVAFGVVPPVAAADPPTVQSARVGSGEVIDFGSFQCTASKSGVDKPVWSCPSQLFLSKFKEPPMVFFSIAGFDRLAVGNGSVSLEIDLKDEVNKEGFQPIIDDRADTPTGLDKSAVRVNWIAIGEGERVRRPSLTREERLKLREKAKGQ